MSNPSFTQSGSHSSLNENANVATGSPTPLSTYGTLSFEDSDQNDAHDVSAVLSGAPILGGVIPAEGSSIIPAQTLTDLGDALATSLSEPGSGPGSVGFLFSIPNSDIDFLGLGETLTVTYNVTVTDSQNGTTTAPVTITITGTDDLPVISAGSGNAGPYNASPHPVDPTVAIADVDSPTMSGATVKVEGVQAGDALALPGGHATFADGTITGVYHADTGTLALSGTASAADYQSALASVTFSSTATAARTFDIQVQDDHGQASNVVHATLAYQTGSVLLEDHSGNVLNTYDSIQSAVDAAATGDEVVIGAGTYHENVTIRTAGITLVGAGDATIIQGTFETDNHIAAGSNVATFLKTATSYTGASGDGIAIDANNVSVQNLKIDGFNYGIRFQDGATTDATSLTDVTVSDTVSGIHKGTTANVTNLSITGGSFSDGYIGIEFAKSTTVGEAAVGTADNVTIDGTSFSDLDAKGIYVEALSNSTIENVTMNDVGQFGAGPASGTAGTGGDGIDLNLKNGSYSNDTIKGFTLTDTGSSNKDGAAADQANGGAIVVEARDQGSYAAAPATYTGVVTIQDGTIDGTSTGIQAGEPSQSNAGPGASVSNVGISGAEHGSGQHGDIANVTQSTLSFTVQDGDRTIVASPTSTGAIAFVAGTGTQSITGGAGSDSFQHGHGNDSFVGGAGIDTATGYGAGATLAFSNGHWTVTDGANTDTLSGVEKVVIDGKTYDLVDHAGAADGGFQSIQAAITAAGTGDVIEVAAGTYDESLVISKGVTIDGANAGIDGAALRGTETTITGQSQITTTQQVVIDGVEFLDNHAYTLSSGDNFVALQVLANSTAGDIVENSVFDRDPTSDPSGFNANGFASSGAQPTHRGIEIASVATNDQITVEHNLFTGGNADSYAGDDWRSAIYSNGGQGQTLIQSNTFENTRSAINADNFSATVTIDGNDFANPATAVSIGVGSDVSHITSITNNTFDRVDTDLNLTNLATPVGFDATATGNHLAVTPSVAGEVFYIDGGSGGGTLKGTPGADYINGYGGSETFAHSGGGDTFSGGSGVDTATGYSSAYHLEIQSGEWVVTNGTDTDKLAGVEKVVIDGKTYDLVDHFGAATGGFQTIQAAVSHAAAGDTILVDGGTTYAEQVTVDGSSTGKDGLTIESFDGTATIAAPGSGIAVTGHSDHWDSDVRSIVTVENAANVTLDGLTIDGGFAADTTPGSNGDEPAGIAYLHASGTIDETIVENVGNSPGGGLFGLQHGEDILVDNGTAAQSAITIESSTVEDFQKTGILVWNADATISGNHIEGIGATDLTAQNGIQIGGSSGTIDGNTISGLGYTGPTYGASGIIAYEPTASLSITDNHITGAGGQYTEGVDLSDVAAATGVSVTGNTLDTLGYGIAAYTYDPSIGLNANPDLSGNSFANIQAGGVGIYFDPEATAPFQTSTAFTQSGSQFADSFHGSLGSDTFSGGAGSDAFVASGGSDIFYGEAAGPGQDSLGGGSPGDVDTVVYAGHAADYTVTSNPDGSITVAKTAGAPEGQGTDQLHGIEAIAFADGTDNLASVKVYAADHQTLLGTYDTIQAAVSAAASGDEVLVGAGTYHENVTLKSGILLAGASEAGVILDGTMVTPGTLAGTTVSNITVTNATNGGMLLDMSGTSQMTDVVFDHVDLSLGKDYLGAVAIGNGQVNSSIALVDADHDSAGLTFQHVTLDSNDDQAGSTAFAYTLFHSVDGAKLVLDDVTLEGTSTDGPTGLGAQWNMSPNTGETADVTIEASHTGGGGNFYVSGMTSATVADNVFDGQGLALNGVKQASVTGNTFEHIGDDLTAGGGQHRGLVIEDAWGTTGDSNITVTGNTFTDITAADGAIALQRFTDGTPANVATIDRLSNVVVDDNSFADLGPGVSPVSVNPDYFGPGAALPTGFAGAQFITGTSGDDQIATATASDLTIAAGGGTDTVTGYDSSYHLAIAGGHWVVTDNTKTDTLIGVEKVVIDGHVYELVDQLGAGTGGFQSVQAAIDAAPSAGGATILIAPGTYTESAAATAATGTGGGLYIDKPDLTLQGVTSDGSPITTAADAQANGATIISGHETDFGSNHFVGVDGTGTTIQGLHLQAGPETDNKLLEIWANDVTVENNFIDVNIGGTTYSYAAAIYFNDNGDPASDTITSYTVDHNILNEGIIVANGVGDPAQGVSAAQQITDNSFIGHFDPTTGEGRYDTVAINGQVAGTGWLLEPTQTPTISGNSFGDNSTPFLLRGSDNDAHNLPSAAEVAQILAANGDATTTYAYALTSAGDLDTATRNDGAGGYHSFAVTNSIDTLNLALDGTPDAVFGGERDYIHSGDTLVVQSGPGAVSSQIMVDGLSVRASADSAALHLTLATSFADGSPIAGGGVHSISLADYDTASHLGANVSVTGNALDNSIAGNSGNNVLDGAGGADILDGGRGSDTLIGGAGDDQLYGEGAGPNENALGVNGDVDTAVYAGPASDYTVTANGDGSYTVADIGAEGEGTDTLHGIESVQFGSGAGAVTESLSAPVQVFASDGTTLVGAYQTLQAANDAASTQPGDIVSAETGAAPVSALISVDNLVVGPTQDSTGITLTLDDGVTQIALGDYAQGAGAPVTIVGNDLGDTIFGNHAADTFVGGTGTNSYYVFNSATSITDSGTGSTVFAEGVNFDLRTISGVTQLVLDDDGLTGKGTAGDDYLQAAGAADHLIGNGGTDTFVVQDATDIVDGTGGTGSIVHADGTDFSLAANSTGVHTLAIDSAGHSGTGTSGNDELFAFAANDALTGGGGTDTFVVYDATDSVDGTGGSGSSVVAEGTDFSLANATAVHILTIDSAAHTGTGTSGSDTLVARAAGDTLKGNGGADTFLVYAASDIVDGTGGTGQINAENTDFSLATNSTGIHTLVVDSAGHTGTGTSSGGDYLLAYGAHDTLKGNGGADTYAVFDATDIVDGTGGTGSGVFAEATDFSLATNAVGINILAVASAGHTGSGTSGSDTLIADAAADTLKGNGGHDTFVVYDATDVVNATGGAGGTIYAENTSFSMATNSVGSVRTLILDGNGHTGTGTMGVDHLAANGDSDTLIGNGGANAYVVAGNHDVIQAGAEKADAFEFAATAANATLNGYHAHGQNGSADTIHLDGFVDHTLASAEAHHHIVQSGANVIISNGVHTIATLTGIHLADLHASDFVFG